MAEYLSSVHNPLIKEIAKLADKKYRTSAGVFIAEGVKLCQELLDSDWCVEQVFVSQKMWDTMPTDLLQGLSQRATMYTVSSEVLDKLSDAQTAQGIVAVVKMRACDLSALNAVQKVLCMEDVRDPGNMGTLLRTAVATGVEAVVLLGNCADIYSPKVVRSSMGAILRLPVLECTYEQAGEIFATKGMKVFAAMLDRQAKELFACEFVKPWAVVLGNEAHGLSEKVLEWCTEKVFVPQVGRVESLNVAVAGSVILYEILRQSRRNE